jgi:hypothetical protein
VASRRRVRPQTEVRDQHPLKTCIVQHNKPPEPSPLPGGSLPSSRAPVRRTRQKVGPNNVENRRALSKAKEAESRSVSHENSRSGYGIRKKP